MSWLNDWIAKELESIQKKNLYRNLKNPAGLDLSSNDYLSLTRHPELIHALQEGAEIYGTGSTASRLIRGQSEVFTKVEDQLADWVGSQASLFVANGFLANLGLIDTICNSKTIVFSDRLNHASILDGIRLSKSIVRYYKHRDMVDLEEKLKKYKNTDKKVIISETIFSMDGDIADVKKLLELKQRYNCVLILDEAHALGIFGKNGAGVSHEPGEEVKVDEIDFRIYTGGKSLGLEGAFIACSNKMKEYLINRMRTLVFSTAPSPAIVYALGKSIEIVKSMNRERKEILTKAKIFREDLHKNALNTGTSKSHIVPIILENEKKSIEVSEKLIQNGYDIRAIRPPTVKESRLRISINRNIRAIDLKEVVRILSEKS